MPSPIPVTAIDFIAVGARYASTDILAEYNRLLPLATADIDHLAEDNYTQDDLDALTGYADQLGGQSADRTNQRSAKKGSRTIELDAIRAGKTLLRRGITAATNAVAKRAVQEGETDDSAAQIVQTYTTQINGLAGIIGTDSEILKTRLASLRAILGAADLAPSDKKAAAGRKKMLHDLDAQVASLPTLAQTKKSLQQAAVADTAGLDEIDGRAYWNMKRLTQTGASYWRANRNRVRAGEYNLTALHTATTHREKAEPPPPPPPGPGSSTTLPIQ